MSTDERPDTTAATPAADAGHALILVVERDPHVRALERYFLEQAGFTVPADSETFCPSSSTSGSAVPPRGAEQITGGGHPCAARPP